MVEISNAMSWNRITKLIIPSFISSIILSVRFSLVPGVVLLFSNLLFIKVSYELVKRQILCLVGFPKLLHHLKI